MAKLTDTMVYSNLSYSDQI